MTSPPDQLSPSYLTVNPDGTITATFTGHVNAAAVDLPEGDANPTTDNVIAWRDPAGTIQEYIEAGFSNGHHVLLLSIGTNLSAYAELFDTAFEVHFGALRASVLNDAGQSSFLQLAPPGSALSLSSTFELDFVWDGVSSGSSAYADLPGASTVNGIASCGQLNNGGGPVIVNVGDAGGGSLILVAVPASGSVPPAGVSSHCAGVMWGN